MAPIQYPQLHDKSWLSERYVDSAMSAQRIADEVGNGCTKFAVYNALTKFGVKRRPHSSQFPLLNDKEWLRQKYETEQLSTVQIAELVGSTVGNVGSHLRSAGIPLRNPKEGLRVRFEGGRSGEQAANWKGGRRETGKYIIVYAPEHPRARAGAMFEHVLVAEQKIGRFIRPGEVVHHVNEDTHDNRPENLEVLTRSEHVKTHYGNGTTLRKQVQALEERVARLEALLAKADTIHPDE